ncbi:hypothetical protein BDW02DRAFT_571690 [Decorospora gaudefroyi]|uniref:TLDc domain-containing protein n=1 Tax=Decorospora gaudefroyi TaxID=184978 RepID=A0A6A5K5Z4_9PLEO|nr:hypothetical protein BDW02DRAFT_571690 [Decorospora gaudefroyi]
MGGQNPSLEQTEMFPTLDEMSQSPSHVHQALFAVLYHDRSPESIMEDLGRYTNFIGEDHINEAWLAKSLYHAYPRTEDAVAAAVPVLLRILLHHGTYPFKPPNTTQLTARQMAIAVALLTARDESITIREDSTPGIVRMRHRNWNDRTRLLFQSLCDTDWSQVATPSANLREREDDEDLVAALESPPSQRKTALPVFDVAKTLPSSHSRKLDGTVSLREMRELLALVLVTSIGHVREEPNKEKAAVESTVLALLGEFPDPDGRMNWEEFQRLTASQMPFLLMNLAILIEKGVAIKKPADTFIYPTTYTWDVPKAIQGIESEGKTSFLTMQHISQLGLVIRRHELDPLRLLRQESPKSLSSSDIVNAFNNSPQGHILLLVRGVANKTPIILVCALPSLTRQLSPNTRDWIEENPFSAPGSDSDCIVQLLPTHRVLRSTTNVARVSANSGDLLFDLGGVKASFTESLETGSLEEGAVKVSFSVDLIEVWGR